MLVDDNHEQTSRTTETRFFRGITTKRIRRGAFPSVAQLVTAIESYIEAHSLDPKPLSWTAKAGDILAKGARARASPRIMRHLTDALH